MNIDELDPDELFQFGNVVFDAASIFGSTTDQAIARVRRCVNRAMIDINRKNRRWSWLKQIYSFNTVANQRIYSLDPTVKKIQQVWITGISRQRIDRIPTTKFVELVPNPELATGIPRLYDFEGVDSNGAIQISLYPMPGSLYPINVGHTKKIMPIKEDTTDVRSWWGMPDNLLSALTQKSAAYACQGINNSKYSELDMAAEALIEDEYAADQENPQTSFRAPMGDEFSMIADGPMLPPTFGNW